LIAVSFASDPEHWNSTLLIGTGAICSSFSARSTPASFVVPRYKW